MQTTAALGDSAQRDGSLPFALNTRLPGLMSPLNLPRLSASPWYNLRATG